MSVVDVDDIEKKEDVEFVIGVGVSALSAAPAALGYQGFTAIDLFKDLIVQDLELDPLQVLQSTIPALAKNCKYLPVFRYLKQAQKNSVDYARDYPIVERLLQRKAEDFCSPSYLRQFVRSEQHKSASDIVSSNPPEKAAGFLPFLPADKFDLALVRLFLSENLERVEALNSSCSTSYRKLGALYDFYMFGPGSANP
ncbi:hypothetical protein [Aquimonas sp.]|uniref:hypothetical protein n=1 Tax=Aquimonas sp. TaxID=1872588 RepID=UPI0037BED64D